MSRSAPRVKRWLRRLGAAGLAAACAGAASLALLDRLYPLDPARLGEVSTVVADREGRTLRAFTTASGAWRLAARPEEVSPAYLALLIAYEDRRFRHHPGVDPLAAGRALWQWLRHGRIVSGASTLSMQAARLAGDPAPRGLAAKAKQAFRALQLEWHLGKDAVLALYLTRAPFGGNLEGVRAASLAWFGKEPLHLTLGEAALLIAIPQSPAATRPDRHPEAAKAARDKILTLLATRGAISERAAEEARAEPIPTTRRPLPFLAPHAALALRETSPSAARIATTLDRDLQIAVEALLRQELPGLAPEATIAALVADHRTGTIRAYVGSADFFDARRQGQVDMARAIRSPGSTLKPFIYAMGIDLGLVHPETVVRDAPTRFGDYQPENFQRHYMGEVTIRTALQESLNVPAVGVLDAIGPERFAAHLGQAGATLKLAGGEKPGLPIALGGVGTTLGDLVALYAALGNDGKARTLRLAAHEPAAKEARLVGSGAAWHVARILEAAPPPIDAVPRATAGRPLDIAYKTGTSYGYRDAWALGYDGRFVVGVWVGRPDGSPSPDRFGRNTAAPLLFKLFDLIPESRSGEAGRAMAAKPAEAAELRHASLPPTLRRFEPRPPRHAATASAASAGAAPPLVLSFPPTGATIALDGEAERKPHLALIAEGGKRPLRWLVNGRPLDAAPGGADKRQAFWPVDGEGFVRVTVIDADGSSATSLARIKLQ
jgi:penicillin-binding protein 1C